MILSPGRRYAFVHIPKTGGTALSLALEARAMRDDILIGDTPKAQRRKRRWQALSQTRRLWKHSRLHDVDTLFDMAHWRIVTLVRNPWDRMVSYYHWLQGQKFDHPAVRLAQHSTFSVFLNDPHMLTSLLTNPYAAYTTDSSGQDRATDMIRLEYFEQDSLALRSHLGFDLAMPRVNRSIRDRDWRFYYSNPDADLIARVCASDITRFNYRFDPDH